MSNLVCSDRTRSYLYSRHARQAVVEQQTMLNVIDAKLDAIHQQDASDLNPPDLSMPERVPAEDSPDGMGSLLLNRLNWGAYLQGQPVEISGWEKQLVTAILQSTDDQSGTIVSQLKLSDDRLKLVHRRFLRRLEYAQMDDRHMRIEEAYENTFRWIWGREQNTEQQWSNFPNWLESPSQLYWVTGKVSATSIILSSTFMWICWLDRCHHCSSRQQFLFSVFTYLKNLHTNLYRPALESLLL